MWSRLAWDAGEIAISSAPVIYHRTRRLAVTGFAPNLRDRRELALMGREKVEAAFESALAVGVRMLILQQQLAAIAFDQMMSWSLASISIASSRTAATSFARQSMLVRDTLSGSVVAASKLSGSTAQLAQRALKPVHTRVSGNMRRLGGR